jgi:hypothetical protein
VREVMRTKIAALPATITRGQLNEVLQEGGQGACAGRGKTSRAHAQNPPAISRIPAAPRGVNWPRYPDFISPYILCLEAMPAPAYSGYCHGFYPPGDSTRTGAVVARFACRGSGRPSNRLNSSVCRYHVFAIVPPFAAKRVFSACLNFGVQSKEVIGALGARGDFEEPGSFGKVGGRSWPRLLNKSTRSMNTP